MRERVIVSGMCVGVMMDGVDERESVRFEMFRFV